nr:hypothetical protein [Gammaproteobacteria bacterium]NIX55103.1 hypothetical protein [candidate division Zixibacteria bacterium]
MDRIKARIKTLVLMWNRPAWAMLAAVFVYTIYGSLKGFGSTNFNYFAYLADAFNHGQFHLRLMPPDLHDLVIYDGKVFLYWFPMPAIMMMPLVAIFGVFLSDVVLTIVLGGVNAYLLTVLLHQAKSKDIHRLEPLKQALLVIFFSFGTAYFTLAPYGKVWHLSQLVSIFFMLLAYLSTISFQGWKAFLFTGLALTGAMLTRSHLILIGIWPAFTLIQNHWGLRWKKLALLLALASLPIFLGAFFILYYNQARF